MLLQEMFRATERNGEETGSVLVIGCALARIDSMFLQDNFLEIDCKGETGFLIVSNLPAVCEELGAPTDGLEVCVGDGGLSETETTLFSFGVSNRQESGDSRPPSPSSGAIASFSSINDRQVLPVFSGPWSSLSGGRGRRGDCIWWRVGLSLWHSDEEVGNRSFLCFRMTLGDSIVRSCQFKLCRE